MLLLGSVIIIPILSYSGTGLKNGKVYNNKADTLYAADAGIEDAKYQIKYDQMSGKFSTYDPHDYNTIWSYSLPQVSGKPEINNKDVNITIKNDWIPKDISAPDKDTANSIISNNKLMLTGGAYALSSYNIVITYAPVASDYDAQGNLKLKVNTVGIWLPPGFSYNGNNNLGSTPASSGYKGGQTVVWTLSARNFTSLPGVSSTDSPMAAKIHFDYAGSNVATTTLTSSAAIGATQITVASTTGFPTSGSLNLPNEPAPVIYTGITATTFTGIPNSGSGSITVSHSSGSAVVFHTAPDAVSWIDTTGSDLTYTYTWDDTVRVFHITSNADDTSVETHVAKRIPQKVGTMVNGDYFATGNSLLINGDGNSDGIRFQRQDSSAIVNNNCVPDDATVAEADMYWASWYKLDDTYPTGSPDNRLHTLIYDDCSTFQNKWDKDSSSGWSIYQNTHNNIYYFRANGNNTAADSTYRVLTLHGVYDINDSSYLPSDGWMFLLSWEQWYSGTAPTSADGLDFAISNDGGTTWSDSIHAFTGAAVGSSRYIYTAVYQYLIPSSYITDNFKIKFYVVGFNGSGQYCNFDNIRINALKPEQGITFKIDGGSGLQQVYLDDQNQPHIGAQELTSDSTKTRVLLTYTYSSSASPILRGFAYYCQRNITPLVTKYSLQPVTPSTNTNGHGTYWVKGDLGSYYSKGTDSYASTYLQSAHAGWSIVFIYSSPSTLQHQIYLYDNFFGSGYDPSGGTINVDFDHDGLPGGTIPTKDQAPFVVPQRVGTEVNAAKMTFFVTEGDSVIDGDYVEMQVSGTSNYVQLYDGTTTLKNIWNGQSYIPGGSTIYDGVDIDTLGIAPQNGQYITWDSGILKPGDTKTNINMWTKNDYFFVVYIVLSFRSEVVTGGSLNYLIHG